MSGRNGARGVKGQAWVRACLFVLFDDHGHEQMEIDNSDYRKNLLSLERTAYPF
jgi:hypothetical protein